MMRIQKVSLAKGVSQTMTIYLNTTQYYLEILWCNARGYGHWYVNFFTDSSRATPIACGIPLLTLLNCVSQIKYLGFNFDMLPFCPSSYNEMGPNDLGNKYDLLLIIDGDVE